MRSCGAVLVTMFSLGALGCKPGMDDIYTALPSTGAAVPAFRYTALDGSVLEPAALRGGPAVIVLWSSTCSASRLALDAIGALQAAYAPRGARVIVLADDQARGPVDSVLALAGVRAQVALASKTLMDTFTHGQSALPWRKAFSLPTFLVLDAQGRVAFRFIGIERDPAKRLADVRAVVDSLVRAGERARISRVRA